MLGCNRIITRTNINILLNIGPGAGGGRKKRGRKSNLPNTLDDDCRFILLDIVKCNCMRARLICSVDERHSALVTVCNSNLYFDHFLAFFEGWKIS